jgi:hypothetical protein
MKIIRNFTILLFLLLVAGGAFFVISDVEVQQEKIVNTFNYNEVSN